jgi:hypothetical protein
MESIMNAQPNNRIHATPEQREGGRPSATPLEGFSGFLAEIAAKYATSDAPSPDAGEDRADAEGGAEQIA